MMKLASGEREAGHSEEGHKCSEGPRWVRSFHDYAGESRELLGGKGYGLAEMTSLGLPIPEGFTITTEACLAYFRGDNQVPEQLWGEVELAIRALESRRGQRLGDPDSPLLVSVRSGAAVSMPGMMDTVLNLGINRGIAEGIARRSGNPAFAYDLYLRFIQMYSEVVMGVDSSHFSNVKEEWLGHAGVCQHLPARLREPGSHHLRVPGHRFRRDRRGGARRPGGAAQERRAFGVRQLEFGEGCGLQKTTTASPTTWAPPSTWSRWCTATSTA